MVKRSNSSVYSSIVDFHFVDYEVSGSWFKGSFMANMFSLAISSFSPRF